MLNRIMRSGLALIFAWLAGSRGLAETQPGNLIPNPGFEDWNLYVTPKGHTSPSLVNELGPTGWVLKADAFERKNDPTFAITTVVGRDAATPHSGAYCVKIVNKRMTDIGLVETRKLRVEPNRSYKIHLWYKGQDIEGAKELLSVGSCMSIMQGGDEDFWKDYSSKMVIPKVRDGTFDWRQLEVVFTTKPTTHQVFLTLQLRRTKGTAWFDDVQLVPADSETRPSR